jgi:hypothetical protein
MVCLMFHWLMAALASLYQIPQGLSHHHPPHPIRLHHHHNHHLIHHLGERTLSLFYQVNILGPSAPKL